MKDFVFIFILFVLVMLFTRWMFNAVMAADMPLWVKYMILR